MGMTALVACSRHLGGQTNSGQPPFKALLLAGRRPNPSEMISDPLNPATPYIPLVNGIWREVS